MMVRPLPMMHWGKVERIEGSLADTVGKINPMRYRGYYQDEETGFFYVGSRYYDPGTGRLINADEPSYLNANEPISANLFAYCGNNAVMNIAPTGHNYHWWDFYRSRAVISNLRNLVISIAIMKPISMLRKYLKELAGKYTEKAAARLFATDVKRALLRKGFDLGAASTICSVLGAVFTILMWVSDPGGAIFDAVDAIDKRPNSGYWDFL